MERFYCKTQILSGTGSLEALAELHITRLLIVADPYFLENGTVNHIAHLSKAEHTEVFSKIAPDPSVTLAAQGTQVAQDFCPDTILALGGGSAMDCAKAMRYFSGLETRFIAVPTTSGSGSEVTDFAILTHDGVKHPLVDARLRPKLAILDDELLQKLPKGLIADTGFDVLTHAVEAFVGKKAGTISDCLAKEAFCLAFRLLGASYGGDTSVRLRLHEASAMAGMAFSQGGLGLCHGMSHVLGGMFHVPHGRLNAILLPAVIGVNGHAAGEKYAHLACSAGLSGSSAVIGVRNLKNGLTALRRQLGLPGSLTEAGIDFQQLRQNIPSVVEAVMADPCCATNPITVEPFMIHQVLEAVTGRG